MTNQEAINVMEKYTDITLSKVVIEAHNMAIKALEKQIPKKPVHVEDEVISNTDLYQCPSCDRRFLGKGIATHCYHCGQALDWESEE